MKRCSISLITKEMQTNTIRRYHLIPIRMTMLKKKKKRKKKENNKCWLGHGETGTLVHCYQECKIVQPLKQYGGSQKIKNRTTI